MPTKTRRQGADNKDPDTKPVKKPRSTRLRYQIMNPGIAPPCDECKAHRHMIGRGNVSNSTMFTAHSEDCSVPSRIHTTPERLSDYYARRTEFLTHYSERISTRHH